MVKSERIYAYSPSPSAYLGRVCSWDVVLAVWVIYTFGVRFDRRLVSLLSTKLRFSLDLATHPDYNVDGQYTAPVILFAFLIGLQCCTYFIFIAVLGKRSSMISF